MIQDPTKGRLCEVCGVRPMIGVACTSFPYSCAYCGECATAGADPEWIFEYVWQDIEGDLSALAEPSSMVTWKDGKFLTFTQWAEWRRNKATST